MPSPAGAPPRVSPSRPMEASSVPATILWWLWRSGHERQLTDCLGATAGVDPAVA